MKILINLLSLLFLIFFLNSMPPTGSADDKCKVLMSPISGSYEGDCKKGLANGNGKATGTDTYEGEFKKGYPDGQGKYTWANGNYYEGEWKKGIKEGKGLYITLEQDERVERKGYWKNDKYIGISKDPYVLGTYNQSIIDRVIVQKMGDSPHHITLSFENGSASDFRVIDGQGRAHLDREVIVDHFPFKGKVHFIGSPKNQSGSTPIEFDIQIFHEGNWSIKIMFTDV